MKILIAFLLIFACWGCDRAVTAPSESNVHEYFAEVLLATDVSGGIRLDGNGQYSAECRLKSRIVDSGNVSHPVQETVAFKAKGTEQKFCSFEYRLPYRYCAMSSANRDINCKVTRSRESGWFVEMNFQSPQTHNLLCTIACMDI